MRGNDRNVICVHLTLFINKINQVSLTLYPDGFRLFYVKFMCLGLFAFMTLPLGVMNQGLHISSIWVIIKLNTKNQLTRLPESALKEITR